MPRAEPALELPAATGSELIQPSSPSASWLSKPRNKMIVGVAVVLFLGFITFLVLLIGSKSEPPAKSTAKSTAKPAPAPAPKPVTNHDNTAVGNKKDKNDCKGKWSDWSVCTPSCGPNPGKQTRTYIVSQPAAKDGKPCDHENDSTQEQNCTTKKCSDDRSNDGNGQENGNNDQENGNTNAPAPAPAPSPCNSPAYHKKCDGARRAKGGNCHVCMAQNFGSCPAAEKDQFCTNNSIEITNTPSQCTGPTIGDNWKWNGPSPTWNQRSFPTPSCKYNMILNNPSGPWSCIEGILKPTPECSPNKYCKVPTTDDHWKWNGPTPTWGKDSVATPSCKNYMILNNPSEPWSCKKGILTPTPTCVYEAYYVSFTGEATDVTNYGGKYDMIKTGCNGKPVYQKSSPSPSKYMYVGKGKGQFNWIIGESEGVHDCSLPKSGRGYAGQQEVDKGCDHPENPGCKWNSLSAKAGSGIKVVPTPTAKEKTQLQKVKTVKEKVKEKAQEPAPEPSPSDKYCVYDNYKPKGHYSRPHWNKFKNYPTPSNPSIQYNHPEANNGQGDGCLLLPANSSINDNHNQLAIQMAKDYCSSGKIKCGGFSYLDFKNGPQVCLVEKIPTTFPTKSNTDKLNGATYVKMPNTTDQCNSGGKEGFQNYVPQLLKETTNWFACRPDINENSKISLLPGFEF